MNDLLERIRVAQFYEQGDAPTHWRENPGLGVKIAEEISHLRASRAELLAALKSVIPALSGYICTSSYSVGFREGWNSCRGLVKVQVETAIANAEKGT